MLPWWLCETWRLRWEGWSRQSWGKGEEFDLMYFIFFFQFIQHLVCNQIPENHSHWPSLQSHAHMNVQCLTTARSQIFCNSRSNFWLLPLLQQCRQCLPGWRLWSCAVRALAGCAQAGRSVSDRQARLPTTSFVLIKMICSVYQAAFPMVQKPCNTWQHLAFDSAMGMDSVSLRSQVKWLMQSTQIFFSGDGHDGNVTPGWSCSFGKTGGRAPQILVRS